MQVGAVSAGKTDSGADERLGSNLAQDVVRQCVWI
jgi:hypothetical protein